jgi:hypothetical protein
VAIGGFALTIAPSLSHPADDQYHPQGRWVERLWNAGERLLIKGHYAAARCELERAEAAAFYRRDAAALTRIYLPLLEACRQIRQLSTDGLISIQVESIARRSVNAELHRLASHGGGVVISASTHFARQIARRSRLTAHPIESLLLLRHSNHVRLTSALKPHFVSGLPVVWRPAERAETPPASPEHMCVSLPPAGDYLPGTPGHALLAESTILLFEALALKRLQHWKIPSDGWQRLAVLRQLRLVDMACEPLTLQLLHGAEKLAAQMP